MTYEQFIAKIKKSLHITFVDGTSNEYNYKTKNGSDYFLVEHWITGGDWGGSCWGDERTSSPVDPQREPDFTEFDKILLLFYPNIGFLQYKSYARLITYNEFTKTEYYGDYTTYGTKEVSLKALYEKLREDGKLID